MVWYGRFAGPDAVGMARLRRRSCRRGSAARCRPTTTPEPKPMKFDWMKETIMPEASAAVRYTVPPFGGLPWPKSCARFVIDELRARLQVFLVEQRLRAHVHVVDVGDVAPAHRRRRASPPRSAGARCRRRRPGASAGRSCSRMPSAISATMPWPLGGISCSV